MNADTAFRDPVSAVFSLSLILFIDSKQAIYKKKNGPNWTTKLEALLNYVNYQQSPIIQIES